MADAPDSRGPAGGDRRGRDRRRTDRRTPPPAWRRPSAFVAYGVAGALVLVLLIQGLAGDGSEQTAAATGIGAEQSPESYTLPPLPPGEIREAMTIGDYETLIAEGDRAVGQIVRTQLFCEPLSAMSMRAIDGVNPTLAALSDDQGRVGAAECWWSREGRAQQFLLVVPPPLAAEFARAPEEEINFVRRRRVPAHVEWLGRSDALSLRYAGVLREILQ
ncbi:MAG: hypothetical protein WD766_05975 [Gemmatimonadota bacterium]